jgi:hypothetical protein
VLKEFAPLIVHHAPMSGVFARAIGDYGYILRDPSEERVLAACHAIQDKASMRATRASARSKAHQAVGA